MTEAPATTPAPAERPMDNATAKLELLFNDLDSYRYVPGVKVTPAMARRLIGLNAENNRNIRPTMVARYARDMRTGNWRKRTGQTVKIGTDGRLLDGAHRMHGVEASGCTVDFDLVFGIDPADILVMDSGGSRTHTDVIKIAGHGNVEVGTAPIVRWIWAWEAGSFRGTTGKVTPTPIEVANRYNQEPGLFDAAAARGLDGSRRGLGTSAAIGTAYVLLSHVDVDTAFGFFDSYISGADLPEGSAILELRTRMGRRRADRTTGPEQLALIIRAWNAYNTLDPDGNRIKVAKLQMTGKGELSNANFPKPKKAATGDLR